MRLILVFLVVSLLGAVANAADPNVEAEARYQAAQSLVEQAERLGDPANAVPKLAEAKAKLDSILSDLPASQRASRMVLGDPLMLRLERALAEVTAKRDVVARRCFDAPTRACVFDLALTTFRDLPDSDGRASALSTIARAQAKAGHFEGALTTTQEIASAGVRASTLGEVAEAQAKAGQFEAALATAREIADEGWRGSALSAIVEAQTQAGQFEAVLAAAREIVDDRPRAHTLHAIAQAQARAGQIGAALATVREITQRMHLDLRSNAFSAIVQAQANAGHFEAALATARESAHPGALDGALSGIAQAQARVGQVEAAFATVREIADARERNWARRFIVELQAKSGQFEAARTTTREIADAFSRVAVLLAIAAAHADAGQVESAAASLEAALATAREIADAWQRANALGAIAGAQAKVGQVEAALATAREIADVDERARALMAIGEVQAESGQIEAALATAQEISDMRAHDGALRAAAAAQAKAGNFEAAFATVREIADAWQRASALGTIAVALAKAEQIGVALLTARKIADAEVQAFAFRAIAEAQAKTGRVEMAIATSQEIAEVGARALAFAAIAAALPSGEVAAAHAPDFSPVTAALDELSGALRWKAARDLEAISGAFLAVYEIDRARWWADVLGAPLAGLRASLALGGAASRLGQAESAAALAQPGAFLSLGADLLHVRSLLRAGGDLGQALSGPAYVDAIGTMYGVAGKAGAARFEVTIQHYVAGEEGPGLLAILPPLAARERGLRTLVTRTATVQEAVEQAGRDLVERLTRAQPGTVQPEVVAAVAEALRALAGAVKRSAVENIRVLGGDGGEGVWLGAVAAQHRAHVELLKAYAGELGQKQLSVVVGLVGSATTTGLQVLSLRIGAAPTAIQTTVKDLAAIGYGGTSWALALNVRDLVAELPQQMVWTLASELEIAWELIEGALAQAEQRLVAPATAKRP